MDCGNILKKCPMFSGMDAEQLRRLQEISRRKSYAKGELLFAEGQPAGGFFVQLRGKVKIYKLSGDAKEQILHVLTPGEPFAEAALFSGDTTFPAYAEALSAGEALFFPRGDFLELLRADPQLSLNMLATMSQFLRRFNRIIERLSVRDVSTRLAQYLLQEIRETGDKNPPRVQLAMTKTQLAAHLGTVSETLSRTLKKLKDNGAISVKGKQITILDMPALEETAGLF